MPVDVGLLPAIDGVTGSELLGAENLLDEAIKLTTSQLIAAPPMTCRVYTLSGSFDFTAVPDTDNVVVMQEALDFAAASMPNVVVEFGPGDYTIEGGLEMILPDKARGLTMRMNGARLVHYGSLSYNVTNNKWFALRIQNTNTDPAATDDYIEDINLINMAAYDTAPYTHAYAPGGGGGEETHGFGVRRAKRVIMTGCSLNNIGDEGLELDYVIGGLIDSNQLFRCNIAEETGGGAISIKNGSRDIVVSNSVITDNVPDAWDPTRQYNDFERTRGSDGKTYKADGAEVGDDPVVVPTGWIDLSVINGGKGPLNYGITIKVINPQDVKSVSLIGNTCSRIEYSGLQFGASGAEIYDVTMVGNTISDVDHAVAKDGSFTMSYATVSSNTISNIRKEALLTEGVAGDKHWTFEGNMIRDVDGDVGIFAAASNYIFQHNTVVNAAGRCFDLFTSQNMNVSLNSFTDCGDVTKDFITASAAGQNTQFENNTVVNCDSDEEFCRNIDVVSGNRMQLASPSYRSINSVSRCVNNELNGGIRRGIPGPLMALNNVLQIDFDLGASTRGAIGLDVAGVSNKGSVINGNTIENNSPQGHCIRIQNQNGESANVIATSNHCGLGSIKTISDLSTASVVENNVVV